MSAPHAAALAQANACVPGNKPTQRHLRGALHHLCTYRPSAEAALARRCSGCPASPFDIYAGLDDHLWARRRALFPSSFLLPTTERTRLVLNAVPHPLLCACALSLILSCDRRAPTPRSRGWKTL